MRSVPVKINAKRFWAVLLVLVLIPLISFFTATDNYTAAQDARSPGVTQNAGPDRGAARKALLPNANKNPLANVSLQNIDYCQIIQNVTSIQKPANRKNIFNIFVFFGSLYGVLLHAYLYFASQSRQPEIYKSRRHFIVPHGLRAPPAGPRMAMAANTAGPCKTEY